jgi:hypothetical protein
MELGPMAAAHPMRPESGFSITLEFAQRKDFLAV